jgi:hypothetical protein
MPKRSSGVSCKVHGTRAVTPGFKGKPECINTCAPGSSFTHVLTQSVEKVLKLYYMTDSLKSNTLSG